MSPQKLAIPETLVLVGAFFLVPMRKTARKSYYMVFLENAESYF